MSTRSDFKENFNYYQINADWNGSRNLHDTEELVDFWQNTSHRIWMNEQTYSFAPHWHTAMEIISPVENVYDARVNGEDYRLNPGDIFIIPPGEVHELTAPEWGKRFIFLMNITLISRLKGFSGIQSILSHPLHITKESYPKIYEDIYQILLQIRNEYFNNNDYAELTIQSLLLNMFVKIGENHNNADELFPNVRLYKQKEYVQKFNQALEYIDSHYMDDVSLEDVADQIGFSKYHFSRLFKQYTGYTFCDYLTFRRIKVAEDYLASPDYSITEVAMQAGFSSISTFNRLFKQQKGCTPSEYRSKNSGPKKRTH